VDDIAFDARRGGELNLTAPHAAKHTAADGDGFGDNFALHGGFFADDERACAHITFDLTVELNFALGSDGAADDKVAAENRRSRGWL